MEQFGAFLPLILIFVVFWVLLIRPQQKKMKVHKEMINNLKRGDKIITSGGIIGEIIKVNENKEITLNISEDVNVQIAHGMVSELLTRKDVPQQTNINKDEKKNSNILSSLFNKKINK